MNKLFEFTGEQDKRNWGKIKKIMGIALILIGGGICSCMTLMSVLIN